MDKRLTVKLNAGRVVLGVLRGFDPFMNLVMDEAVEECKDGQNISIGMVVSYNIVNSILNYIPKYIHF